MTTYGQFCPVAKAMEILDERWTMLVVRELLSGSTHFNELRRGLPRMSPTLLSRRLQSLERHGVVKRTPTSGRVIYELTESGKELSTVIDALGAWGTRWVPELGDDELDPHLLMWDVHRMVPIDSWPRSRTVVSFTFDDISSRDGRWWLVVDGGAVDVCDFDPGFDVTASVSTSLRTFVKIWRGDLSWDQALGSARVTIAAPAGISQAVPGWLGKGMWAEVERPARITEHAQAG